jgi:hypothetical protein
VPNLLACGRSRRVGGKAASGEAGRRPATERRDGVGRMCHPSRPAEGGQLEEPRSPQGGVQGEGRKTACPLHGGLARRVRPGKGHASRTIATGRAETVFSAHLPFQDATDRAACLDWVGPANLRTQTSRARPRRNASDRAEATPDTTTRYEDALRGGPGGDAQQKQTVPPRRVPPTHTEDLTVP